jgi:hypothetical protein
MVSDTGTSFIGYLNAMRDFSKAFGAYFSKAFVTYALVDHTENYGHAGLGTCYKSIMAWFRKRYHKCWIYWKIIFNKFVMSYNRLFFLRTSKSLTCPKRFKGWKFSR